MLPVRVKISHVQPRLCHFKAELLQRAVSKDPLVNCCIQLGGGGQLPMKTIYTCAPLFIGKIDQILALFMASFAHGTDQT